MTDAEKRAFAAGIEAAAEFAENFTTAKHVAIDIKNGVFPDQSPTREAMASGIRALSPTLPPPAAMPETPTSAQLYSVCLSLRNDYGLMKREDQEALKLQTWQCWWAISRALAELKGEN